MHKKFTTVDQYIVAQSVEDRIGLETLRHLIQKAAPKAEELISYSMPAFKFHGMLAFYAVFKSHYGLYVPNVLNAFKSRLTPYEWSKATIRFPKDKPIPKKLVTDIIKYAVKRNLEMKMLKDEKKNKKAKAKK